jgi:acetylornithine/succinyldiaminopimelate/putrescine aminotransferase
VNVLATEKRYLARERESKGVQVTRSKGSYLFDAKRKKYVDFVMGWCVGNLGWDNPVARDRIRRFAGPDYVYPGYSFEGWAELARLLARITPGTLTKSFRATGGSEAVEIALQAAMLHTKRGKFLSIEDSYHGNTLGALSVGASEYRKRYRNLLPHCQKIAPPLNANALDRVETRLKRRDVAAFIMEPIIINLGVLIPDSEFMTGLQGLCRRYGTLLVMDEVATGFGRTGKLFASEHFKLQPDIMCVAKAVTGGCAGMGATIATAEVARAMEENGNFYSTYGWHPLSVDVAIANIEYLMQHRKRLLENVAATSDYFYGRLSAMDFEEAPEIRMRGLAIGVDVGDEEYASKIKDECRKAGLLLTTESSALLLLPALNIERVVARKGLDILESCL